MRVLVVDDHPLVRRGLVDLLSPLPDVEAVTTAEGAGAAEAAVTGDVDVVLMDLSMPVVDGLEATRQVLQRRPATRVVVLTTFAEHERIRAALDAGAVGYLLKDAEPEQIIAAVRDAAAGHAPFSARASAALLADHLGRTSRGTQTAGTTAHHPADPAVAAGLTGRERQVLALVATGLPNKSIARRLGISEKTVKAHLTRVFTVLKVNDRTSAALWAQRYGLTVERDD